MTLQDAHTTTRNGQTETIPDKAEIREEWEAMRQAFPELLADIPEEAWRRQSKSTRWTVAELCGHIANDVEWTPKMVEHARTGKDLINVGGALGNFINWLHTKISSRNATPESLAQKYDADFADAMAALDTVHDEDWQRGAHFFGEGYWTVEFIFRYLPQHFDEHAEQVRESLAR